MIVSILLELFQISVYLGLFALLVVFSFNFIDITLKIVVNFLFAIVVLLATIYDVCKKVI